MKKLFLLSCFCFSITTFKAQSYQSADTIKAPANLENIFSKPLYSDSLVSSYVIFIKKEVKLHKHVFHTEHVIILEGEGEMLVAEKKIKIKKGDIVFIPKGTPHALFVTSAIPVKIISVQSPHFDGTDRVMIK